MARPRRIDEELVRKAQYIVNNPKGMTELRCAQAILLSAVMAKLSSRRQWYLEFQEFRSLVCKLGFGKVCKQANTTPATGKGVVEHS